MTTYFLTGGTGFIGSRLAAALLDRPDCDVLYLLVRESSRTRLAELMADWPNFDRAVPIVGDLTVSELGVDVSALDQAPDHVVHLAASYDMTVDDQVNVRANVDGTRHALEFAAAVGRRTGQAPVFHHVSSVAVSGDHAGPFTEADFDLGQGFPSSYHRTKFEAEKLVRDQADRSDGVPYRVYRPSVVLGDSTTGEIDKVDGPYYLLPMMTRMALLPHRLPLVSPDPGGVLRSRMNVVPVDYVVSSMAALIAADVPSGSVFHLGSPTDETYLSVMNVFADILNAPRVRSAVNIPLPSGGHRSMVRRVFDETVSEVGIPPQLLAMPPIKVRFDTKATASALAELGLPGTPPPLRDYAPALIDYWLDNLDPDRARRTSRRHPLRDKVIVITGASSGIGRALALEVGAMGAVVLLLARRGDELDAVVREITAAGGRAGAYPVDLTDDAAVDATVKQLLAEHDHVDYLVNNAGRSIRRSVMASVDRLHDYERTMAINYTAVVRLTLALLPSMIERQSGHIVNVTTAAVDARLAKWSAYTASKAAIDTFGLIAGEDLLSEGITVSNVRMPLVATPMSAPSREVNRRVPVLTAEAAAHKYIVRQALIRKKPLVNTAGGPFITMAHSFSPRATRLGAHLIAGQAMGETAPDGRERNTAPAPARVAGAATRLAWRRLATRPVRRTR
ncbi:SDR family oxidoreductase [Jongsikchunia kroppenstedtii]|uniref:SDR family oxidoreductase n=1 Tax=Jongsikchunia kroppenstedtii TaxID=1121721 RepID=UPI00036FFEBE|nr:SDR family oxidoreductase [Jongsikchunia kroppenstedtii]